MGDLTYIHGITPTGRRVTISVKGFHDFKHADSVGYDLKLKDAHLFDAEGRAI